MANLKDGVYIPNIDGKDIFLSNIHNKSQQAKGKKEVGYTLKCRIGEQQGKYNFKRFGSKLDYSLDLFKMQEVYQRVYNAKNFSFVANGKNYSTHIINVTFNYNVREFNRTANNTYVRLGYSPDESDFHDGVVVDDGKLIGIKVEQDIKYPVPDNILGKYFRFCNGQYVANSNIPVVKKVSEIREELYKNGFVCDGIQFVRYKRSAGSSRLGTCLFIDKRLYAPMIKWSMCGLKIAENQEIDLAALEAYISLTLSSIIGTVEIKPENILLIDDYKSKFIDHVIATRFENGQLISKPEDVEITNNIWDGQSLMDRSLFLQFQEQQRKDDPDAKEHGMLLLRARFFKSCCFNANIQQWFVDNGITDVGQLCGKTQAKKVEDIKLITTPSSIKFLKFGRFDEWLDEIESTFGVVKHEKPTHFFDGRMVQTHYQLLNTLQITYDEVEKLVKPSLDYANMIKIDPAALKHHIDYQYCTPDETYYNRAITSKNDIITKMLETTDCFSQTKLYRDFAKTILDSFKKNLRCGHILVHGNYSVLCGNPIEMLMQSIGQFSGNPIMEPNTVHSTYFADGEELLGSRSPHVTMGNVLVTKNVQHEEITRYLNPTPEIVYINSINENILERLSGADFDSDTIMLTNNEIMLQAAKRNYEHFPVPTKLVEATNLKRKYTNFDKADLDIKTSVNKIGEIINLSQELNSILWDSLYHGASIEDVMELYCDIAQLDVMSNLEIDSAKRENPADNTLELKKLKEKYGMRDEKGRHIRPLFFQYVDEYKGYRDGYYIYIEEDGEYRKHDIVGTLKEANEIKADRENLSIEKGRMSYIKHETAMDYLEKAISRYQMSRWKSKDLLDFADCLIDSRTTSGQLRSKQARDIVVMIQEAKRKIDGIWKSDQGNNAEKRNAADEIESELITQISKLSLEQKTMYHLLKLLDKKDYTNIRKFLFIVLFQVHNGAFYELIRKRREPVYWLIEVSKGNGTTQIYDFEYIKSLDDNSEFCGNLDSFLKSTT
jgi:hypothetical protein